jgi:hypothetical protein
MKARQLAETLRALAGLADATRADELRRFAIVFSGNDETIAARLKKMSPAGSHPASLKESLEEIRAGFEASGATKQATAIRSILDTFLGRGDATVDGFIREITTPRPAKMRAAKPPPAPDHQLAKGLADRLTSTVLDTTSFNEVVHQLRAAKQVNTPTLIAVAHRFLGSNKPYSGRKAAIDDIVRRQKADAREHARGKALSRVGV